ncbi:helix-turn-helix transcriptional regulator [Rhodococcus sp. W8901]|nr:helix-turn-helix transcriptional regulator [Rhodococcus sp. W8901]
METRDVEGYVGRVHDTLYHRFEFSFIVPLLTLSREATIAEEFGGRVDDRSGLQLLTVTTEGMRCATAGMSLVDQLAARGVRPLRTHPDLVTRQDVADRAGVTRQAVGQWVRGVRQKGTPFPVPFNTVSGGIWLWGDVYAWLRHHDYGRDTGLRYPTLDEHVRIDRHIVMNHRDD